MYLERWLCVLDLVTYNELLLACMHERHRSEETFLKIFARGKGCKLLKLLEKLRLVVRVASVLGFEELSSHGAWRVVEAQYEYLSSSDDEQVQFDIPCGRVAR